MLRRKAKNSKPGASGRGSCRGKLNSTLTLGLVRPPNHVSANLSGPPTLPDSCHLQGSGAGTLWPNSYLACHGNLVGYWHQDARYIAPCHGAGERGASRISLRLCLKHARPATSYHVGFVLPLPCFLTSLLPDLPLPYSCTTAG